MKRWFLIVLATGVFLFLVARLLIKGYVNGETEREWYREQLDFRFSGIVDTVIMRTKYHGLIVFHVTEGSVDKDREDRLNDELVYNTHIRFLGFTSESQIQFNSKIAFKYLPGDSVSIDTEQNTIASYRKGKLISTYPVMESLNERFF